MYIYGSIQTYSFGYKQMILFARQLRNGNFSIEFDNNNINSNNNNRAINTIVRQNFTCIQNWRKRLTRFRFIFSLTSDFPRNFLPSPLSWRYGISLNFSIWNPDNFAYFDDIQIRVNAKLINIGWICLPIGSRSPIHKLPLVKVAVGRVWSMQMREREFMKRRSEATNYDFVIFGRFIAGNFSFVRETVDESVN